MSIFFTTIHLRTDTPARRDLLDRTAPPEVPVDLRYTRLPEGFTLVGADDAKLLDFMGRTPVLIEGRRVWSREVHAENGHWTLYWSTPRSGWAARSTWSDSPVPSPGRFARWDTSCQHPNLWTTERSSTYRVSECPDCGFRSSHDSGD